MGGFCCHGYQTKRQTTIILVVFKSLIQVTFLPNHGQITSMALEELSFESVNRWTDKWTDGRTTHRQKLITIAHPEHS